MGAAVDLYGAIDILINNAGISWGAPAADFAPASYEDWRKLVDGVLKGAPFEKLVGKTSDGRPIEPIYRRARNAAPIAGRAAPVPWQVMQRIDHPNPGAANAQALHDLENGATGLEFEFAGGTGARGFGIADAKKETLARAFDGIIFDAGIAIALNPVLGRENAGENLADIVEARGFDLVPALGTLDRHDGRLRVEVLVGPERPADAVGFVQGAELGVPSVGQLASLAEEQGHVVAVR